MREGRGRRGIQKISRFVTDILKDAAGSVRIYL